jgi:hypothetical protein
VSIPKLVLPPTIVILPPVVVLLVNLFILNPYVGSGFNEPLVLKPAVDLSCQYFRTPVT